MTRMNDLIKEKIQIILRPIAKNFNNNFHFHLTLFPNSTGGYYTIEQTKSRLRIIVLNTNFMRHDYNSKYSQSHLSAVRQRPDGSYVSTGRELDREHQQQHQYSSGGYHRKHYHHDNDEHDNNNNYKRYNKENRYYNSHSSSDEARFNNHYGAAGNTAQAGSSRGVTTDENGAIVSALSVSHESEKQWEWFEMVLEKSLRNKETVSAVIEFEF